MVRLGLSCTFRDEPIKFATATATALGRMPRDQALAKLARLCRANAESLMKALEFCSQNQIGCFRVNSQILPLKTHPTAGYAMEELPEGAEIVEKFRECGAFARQYDLRTSFHPDQFVVLNSNRPEVVDSSVRELEYQAEVAEWIHADVLNIHGGGAYGNKPLALQEFARNLEKLSANVRTRLTLENDDKIYTPDDLLPLCRAEAIPLVYDIHHHRCHSGEMTLQEATREAAKTWNREPMFHVSSPIEGWDGPKPERHHDFIDLADFPESWDVQDWTVEVEAKAKEVAVLRLRDSLRARSVQTA